MPAQKCRNRAPRLVIFRSNKDFFTLVGHRGHDRLLFFDWGYFFDQDRCFLLLLLMIPMSLFVWPFLVTL